MSAEYTIYFVTKVVICDDCYGSSINIKYHDVDLKAPYPDDFDCPACNGKGSIESSVPLEDALRELGFGLTPRAADGSNVPQIGSLEQQENINKKVAE